MSIIPVILSGGSGTRLWPLSTEQHPKQFLDLLGDGSLFSRTLARTAGLPGFADPIVVANARHADLCHDAMQSAGRDALLILEPVARNTAAAIVMAAMEAARLHGPESLILVMPSDHVMTNPSAFIEAVRHGTNAAAESHLVTFGIRPTRPETGFGYIERGASIGGESMVFEGVRFIEKPPLDEAKRMVASGNYDWNAGIFLFRADVLLAQAELLAPAIFRHAAAALSNAARSASRVLPDEQALNACPSESIDYAIMEKADRIAIVPVDPGWSDLGSWDALAQADQRQTIGNATLIDCDDTYVRAEGVKIAALGLDGFIVVSSGDHVLILPKGRSQEVKALLAQMDGR
jgi:mannose-1-phosphate guanylyltransferase/mannose-6-phosphate isomerase